MSNGKDSDRLLGVNAISKHHFNYFGILGVLLIICYGCASSQSNVYTGDALPPYSAIVFGKITIPDIFWPCSVRLIDKETNMIAAIIEVSSEGSPFFLMLPVGEYMVTDFQTSRTNYILRLHSEATYDFRAVFTVPKANEIDYVGDITISIGKDGISSKIDDNQNGAEKLFRTRFPNTKLNFSKQLLKKERPQ